MDPIKVLQGYDKVINLEDQTQPTHRKSDKKSVLVVIAISAIVLLTLIIGLIIRAVIGESISEPPEFPSVSSNKSEEMIRTICNVTLYPDSCFTSISSVNTLPDTDPEEIFKLSLQISLTEISKISLIFKDSNSTSNGGAAMKDCETQIEDALSRIKDSIAAMDVINPGEKLLTERKIDDIQTWISAAMTEEESCTDGLEETESKILEEMRRKIEKSKEYLSISLAIVSNILMIFKQFNISLH